MKQKSSTHSRIICYEQAPFLEIRVTDQSDRVYESHAHPTLSIGAMREWKTSFRTPKGEFLLEEDLFIINNSLIINSVSDDLDACTQVLEMLEANKIHND